MTEAEFKAMLADREAGTPAPWHITACADRWVQHGERGIAHCGDIEWHGADGVVDNFPEMDANARRIARVPALESEVIRLRKGLMSIMLADQHMRFQNHNDGTSATDMVDGQFAGMARATLTGDEQ